MAVMLGAPLPVRAATPGVVVSNTGGKDTPLFAQWQEFRRAVDDRSAGSLLLDYLIFGELGTAQSMLQAVVTGRATIGGFSCGGITQAIPELAVPQMPFLFGSQEEADFVFDRFLTPIYSDVLAQHGLVLLQWTDYGFTDVYAKDPVEFPAQLAGRQVRSMNNIAGPILLQALKATWVDVGITQIAASAQETKLFAALGSLMGYDRLQPTFRYYTKTHHAYNCGVIVANKAWFESATPQEQQILRSSYPAPAEVRAAALAQTKSHEARLVEKGTVFLTPTPEQHNAWAAAGLPLYPAILERAGGRSIEIYDLIRAGKQTFLRQPATSAPR